jgi:hypothetical protein
VDPLSRLVATGAMLQAGRIAAELARIERRIALASSR